MNYLALLDTVLVVGALLFVLAKRDLILGKITDTNRKARAARALNIVAPLALLLTIISGATRLLPTSAAEDVAAEINSKLPRKIDELTRLDAAKAESPTRLVLEHTVTSLRAAQISPESWERFKPQLLRQITEKPSVVGGLSQKGVTVIYRYRDAEGHLIGELEVPRESTGSRGSRE